MSRGISVKEETRRELQEGMSGKEKCAGRGGGK